MLNFQAEIEAFKKALPDRLKNHQGEFAILKDGALQHVSPTYQAALTWGYSQYGLDDHFFVKEVSEVPQVTHFRRR